MYDMGPLEFVGFIILIKTTITFCEPIGCWRPAFYFFLNMGKTCPKIVIGSRLLLLKQVVEQARLLSDRGVNSNIWRTAFFVICKFGNLVLVKSV